MLLVLVFYQKRVYEFSFMRDYESSGLRKQALNTWISQKKIIIFFFLKFFNKIDDFLKNVKKASKYKNISKEMIASIILKK